jgi:hypothetical protein
MGLLLNMRTEDTSGGQGWLEANYWRGHGRLELCPIQVRILTPAHKYGFARVQSSRFENNRWLLCSSVRVARFRMAMPSTERGGHCIKPASRMARAMHGQLEELRIEVSASGIRDGRRYWPHASWTIGKYRLNSNLGDLEIEAYVGLTVCLTENHSYESWCQKVDFWVGHPVMMCEIRYTGSFFVVNL